MGSVQKNGLPVGLLEGYQKPEPGLLGFISRPDIQALAQGLLAGGQPGAHNPNGSFGGALSHAFGHMNTRMDKESEKLRELAKIDMLKSHLDLDREKLGLEKSKVAQTLQEKAQQRKVLDGILNGDISGKSVLGVDPTPDQIRRAKIASAISTEEALKILAEKDPSASATGKTITANQSTVQAIDNVMPVIDGLINEKGNGIDVPYQNPWYLGGDVVANILSPQRQAAYHAEVAKAADQLIGALNLPKTNESIELVEKMLEKQPNEGDTAYHARLKNLKTDLIHRRKSSSKIAPSINQDVTYPDEQSSGAPDSNDPLGWRK